MTVTINPIVVGPTLTPLAAKERLKIEKPFVHENWKYEWDDSSERENNSPYASAMIYFGNSLEGAPEQHEFYVNGDPGDPIDEDSYWVAA